jgi:hypothetical protein
MAKARYWAGFMDGKIDTRDMDTGFSGFGNTGMRIIPAIFTSKTSASEQYEDVREIEIKEIPRKKRA